MSVRPVTIYTPDRDVISELMEVLNCVRDTSLPALGEQRILPPRVETTHFLTVLLGNFVNISSNSQR